MNESPHAVHHIVEMVCVDEGVKHFASGLGCLTEEARVIGSVKPRLILFVCFDLPAILRSFSQVCLFEDAARPGCEILSDHDAPPAVAVFLPRRARRIMRRNPAACCSAHEPLTRAGSAPASPVSIVLSLYRAVLKRMSHIESVVPKLQLRRPAARSA